MLLLAAGASLAATTGCRATASGVDVAGRVVDDTVVVAVPTLPTSLPRVAAGVGDAQPVRGSAVATLTGLGKAARVTSVPVRVGDRVAAGQVVARLDDRALAAELAAARAGRRAAAAQVDVIDTKLQDIDEARGDIADQRASVADALSQIEATRAELNTRLSQARAQLAELRSVQRRLEQLSQQRPPSPPPGVVPPGVTPTGTPGGGLPPGVVPPGTPGGSPSGASGPTLPDPAQIAAGIAKLEAGIAQLEAAITKLDAGETQARSGLARLGDASATAQDAQRALRNARQLARIASRGSVVAVDLAQVQRNLATLRSPVAGVVVETASAGEALVAGAPLVTIRPDGPVRVEAWVPPADAQRIAPGSQAGVSTDSHPDEQFAAAVSWLSPRAVYPPTFLPTQEVHLTRAVRTRLTLDDASVWLPPGTPADVRIELSR